MGPSTIRIMYFYNYKIHRDNSSSKGEKCYIVWSSTKKKPFENLYLMPLTVIIRLFTPTGKLCRVGQVVSDDSNVRIIRKDITLILSSWLSWVSGDVGQLTQAPLSRSRPHCCLSKAENLSAWSTLYSLIPQLRCWKVAPRQWSESSGLALL